jgi:hypothetical protein
LISFPDGEDFFMGLRHSFKSARKRIDLLDGEERESLLAVCRDIRQAQKVLTEKAAPLLANCMACQGLCCRNIHPADIITEWDLVYILAMAPQIEAAMAVCLAREAFFPADCIFLENGTGPCLFPDNLRPERCVISFCRVEPSVQDEIGRVMSGFSRLIRFFMFRPLRRLSRRLMPADSSRRTTG